MDTRSASQLPLKDAAALEAADSVAKAMWLSVKTGKTRTFFGMALDDCLFDFGMFFTILEDFGDF
jgi:ribose 5-phosphate isomerase